MLELIAPALDALRPVIAQIPEAERPAFMRLLSAAVIVGGTDWKPTPEQLRVILDAI